MVYFQPCLVKPFAKHSLFIINGPLMRPLVSGRSIVQINVVLTKKMAFSVKIDDFPYWPINVLDEKLSVQNPRK